MAGLPVITKCTEYKGRGLFATRDFSVGEVIFTEQPLVSCQFSWNKLYKYRACDHCMRSLETAQEMCRRLCADDSIVLPKKECCEVDSSNHVSCPSCSVVYCSLKCKDESTKQYHRSICMCDENPIKESILKLDETWRQMHYPPETATILILVKLIAKIKQSSDKARLIKEAEAFCTQTKNEEDNIIHKLLGKKFKEQIDLLHQQFVNTIHEEAVGEWFTLKGFKSLLALLGTNQQGVGSCSISTWVKNCDNLELPDSERSELDCFIDSLYQKMDEISGEFLNCEGVGLYRLQSCCNHSCSPDAEICFEHGDHTLTLKALKPILSGSEIHISYLGECDQLRSRHSRQKTLSENYLFHCKCSECENQIDDPDVTSEEESDDDETMDM